MEWGGKEWQLILLGMGNPVTPGGKRRNEANANATGRRPLESGKERVWMLREVTGLGEGPSRQ